MKRSADVVIIGGGIQGVSCAYHLAARGITNVALVEMELIGSGSSGRSAAMFVLSMTRQETIRLSFESLKEYLAFEELFGESSHLHQIGYLAVATERAEPGLRRDLETQRRMGVPMEVLSPQEIKELVPALAVDDLVFGTLCRQDGVMDPHVVMQAYARGARQRGVEVDEKVQALGLVMRGQKVEGVETAEGVIHTPLVVNAAGAWAKQVGSWAGLDLPITNYKRHIFVTDAFPAIPPDTPFVTDVEAEWYFRKEGAGVLIGMGREEAGAVEPQVEWEFLDQIVDRALVRAPILADARIVRGWAGMRPVTPDDLPILGYAPGVEGFINCCGWGGHGVTHAPIGGRLVAELIADGHTTTLDLAPFSLERFEQETIQPPDIPQE